MVVNMRGYKISIFVLIPVIIVTAVLLILSAFLFDEVHDALKFPSYFKKEEKSLNMTKEMFWQKNDFSVGNIPEHYKRLEADVDIQSKRVNVMGVDVFYRMAEPVKGEPPSGQHVLLLHGQKFTSKNWLDLGTIRILATFGHKVVAVDLPGFGESGSFSGEKSEFLKTLIAAVGLKDVIIVSPSYSGLYSVPYIESYWKEASGYVPVAAVANQSFKTSGSQIKIPTLNIIGELDSTPFGLLTKDYISFIETSQSVIIPKVGHAAYLSAPDLFHKLLYNFIKGIKLQLTL